MGHWFLKSGFLKSGLLKFAGLVCLLITAQLSGAVTGAQTVLVRDITTIAGVRDNPLVGYSLVVGLNGTGDRQQTLFYSDAG